MMREGRIDSILAWPGLLANPL